MSLSAIPRPLRAAVATRDDGACQYCKLHQTGQAAAFHVDHVIPRSRGGATALDNLALQCPHCSLHKSDRLGGLDPETGEQAPLFHPLRDIWHEHFKLLGDGTCAGVTATGRATAAALRMNDPLPKTARALQLMLRMI